MAFGEQNKRNWLYLVFAGFIVAIFLWWWVLLFNKNENVYAEKLALYDLIIDIDDSETTLQLYEWEVDRLNRQYRKQKLMIAGEGFTFFLLLILGIVRLNQYFRKEIGLARQQSNFLLSITHELRSPLASALLNNETLLKRPGLAAEQRDSLLRNSSAELKRLESLVDKLLFAARLEGEEVVHDEQAVELSVLYAERYETYAARYGGEFSFSGRFEPDLAVHGDAVLLQSVLVNLLDNAVKYCPREGRIDVELSANDGWAVLRVANEGPGIGNAEKQHIWKKFYRVGEEQTRSTTGTGLGLYIVRKIAEAHRGRVAVLDKPGGGVIFEAGFPAARPRQRPDERKGSNRS